MMSPNPSVDWLRLVPDRPRCSEKSEPPRTAVAGGATHSAGRVVIATTNIAEASRPERIRAETSEATTNGSPIPGETDRPMWALACES